MKLIQFENYLILNKKKYNASENVMIAGIRRVEKKYYYYLVDSTRSLEPIGSYQFVQQIYDC